MPDNNSHVPEEVLEKAEKLDLRYTTDSIPGIHREGSKAKPLYKTPEGKTINDAKSLKRIKDLVIPPAWTDVWISPYANTHLQATGIDQKGRKQYLYHKKWEQICQEAKFDRVEFFGQHLPRIREQVERDMVSRGLTQQRVIATVVWLLEHTFIRIGNEEYAKENQSFGLTTLRNKHVDVDGDRIKFSFKGKSGVEHEKDITNPTVVKTIRKCIELPGYEVFQYLDENRERHTVDSEEVNEYLQSVTGEQVTAKDFRTWGGTMLSANYLCQMDQPKTQEEKKQNIRQTCKKVSKNLGNTPTVCRSYYIHPTIFRTYEKDILVPHIREYRSKPQKENFLKPTEFAVIELLRKYPN